MNDASLMLFKVRLSKVWVSLAVTLALLVPPAALADTPSAHLFLSGLTVSEGVMVTQGTQNDYHSGTFTYFGTVRSDITQVDVTPTVSALPNFPAVTATVNGTTVESGTSLGVNLNMGRNVITIVTSDENGASATYRVIVNRCKPGCGSDASLSALEVTPNGIDDFTPEGRTFTIANPNSVETVTIRATPTDPDATVVINKKVMESGTDFQVPLIAGDRVTVKIVVHAENANTESPESHRVYGVLLDRASSEPGHWNVLKDLEVGFAGGIWSDGETLWGVNRDPRRLDAVDLDTGSAIASSSFSLTGTSSARGLVAHGNTVWVVDGSANKLVAYYLTTGSRKASSDIALDSDNTSPTGAGTDGTHIWVANDAITGTDRLYAYNISELAADRDYIISLRDTGTPAGVWVDPDTRTVWVVNQSTGILNAYDLDDDDRDGVHRASSKDIPLKAGINDAPWGIWLDETTVWVTDVTDGKVYTYNRAATTADPDTPANTPSDTPADTPSPGDPSPGDPSPGDPSPGDPSPGDPSPGDPSPGDPSPGDPSPVTLSPGTPSPGGPSPGSPSPGNSGGGEQDGGEESLPASDVFTDVPPGSWFEPAVTWMVRHGVTLGCSATLFCPQRQVTRQEFVTFLWRAAGQPSGAFSGSEAFSDVDGGFADQAIGWAASTGVTTGCTAGAFGDEDWRFCPDQSVSRAQIATFLFRLVEGPVTAQATFEDVPAESYFSSAASWMSHHGITSGCAVNMFCPHRPATRAEVASLIHGVVIRPHSWGPGNTVLSPSLG